VPVRRHVMRELHEGAVFVWTHQLLRPIAAAGFLAQALVIVFSPLPGLARLPKAVAN
jgi:hypothetical protein